MIRVWARLEQTASRFLDAHSLALTISGRAYLSWLCLRAARVIAGGGSADDPSALAFADSQLELLLATAAGISTTGGENYLGEGPAELLAGLPRGHRGRISASDLRDALRRLGSIWPFVEHGRK